jgi:hypothetical protein
MKITVLRTVHIPAEELQNLIQEHIQRELRYSSVVPYNERHVYRVLEFGWLTGATVELGLEPEEPEEAPVADDEQLRLNTERAERRDAARQDNPPTVEAAQ